MNCRRLIVGATVLISMGLIWLVRIHQADTFNDKELLSLRLVSDVESRLGKAIYIYEKYPPKIGLDMVTATDFEENVVVHVYTIKKMPPHFLVIKKRRDSDFVIRSKTEDS